MRAALTVLVGVLVVGISGCGLQEYVRDKVESIEKSGIPSTIDVGQTGTYIDTVGLGKLAKLPVRNRVSMKGYWRGAFGPLWDDNVNVEFGHNGCNTRDDILRRDLTDVVQDPPHVAVDQWRDFDLFIAV